MNYEICHCPRCKAGIEAPHEYHLEARPMPSSYVCSVCKTPLAAGYTCPMCGSDAAEEAPSSIGERVESWYCYGIPSEPLEPAQREEVIEFARSFEECSYGRDELEAMDDGGIISAAYSAMADYARGQM